MDTEDWIEEVYSKEKVLELSKIVVIEKVNIQDKILSFISSYISLMSEIGSSSMDFIDSYLDDKSDLSALRYDISSDSCSMAKSLKERYKELKVSWKELKISEFYNSELFKCCNKCLEHSRWGRKEYEDKIVSVIASTFHFQESKIKECFYL